MPDRARSWAADPDQDLAPPGPGTGASVAKRMSFERSDAGLLEHVLRADATLEATPFRDWQAGRVNCPPPPCTTGTPTAPSGHTASWY